MTTKIIVLIVILSTLGIIGIAVWQQKKRLPELESRMPPKQEQFTPPPGLGKGQSNPLEFASLFKNLKPEKQECFKERFGSERLDAILKSPTFIPTAEDNAVIGECLLAGATFVDVSPSPAP